MVAHGAAFVSMVQIDSEKKEKLLPVEESEVVVSFDHCHVARATCVEVRDNWGSHHTRHNLSVGMRTVTTVGLRAS